MKKAIIIGGTGLMGPHLIKELQDLNIETICINRSGKHPFGGKSYVCDRNNIEVMMKIFDEQNDFILFDMIPFTAVNAGIVILALNGKQPPMICASSCDVYEAYNILHNKSIGLQNTPLTELSKTRDRISFQGSGYDKLNIERIYLSYFDCCAIVRLPAIYGLPDTNRIYQYLQKICYNKFTLNSGFAHWRFSRSSNINCAYGLSLCVKNTNRNIYNISEKEYYSEIEWTDKIHKLGGYSPNIILDDKIEIPYNMNINQNLIIDSSKIRNELGYHEKYDVNNSIIEVIDFYKKSAQQGDAPEPATNAIPASQHSIPPAR
ncbi:hypothetical protein LBMAG53_21880 [Planctomycetota bacterium]|nr:hypothetical protein LBMAG53_21880 [Planctomycetota bacterium]